CSRSIAHAKNPDGAACALLHGSALGHELIPSTLDHLPRDSADQLPMQWLPRPREIARHFLEAPGPKLAPIIVALLLPYAPGGRTRLGAHREIDRHELPASSTAWPPAVPSWRRRQRPCRVWPQQGPRPLACGWWRGCRARM